MWSRQNNIFYNITIEYRTWLLYVYKYYDSTIETMDTIKVIVATIQNYRRTSKNNRNGYIN